MKFKKLLIIGLLLSVNLMSAVRGVTRETDISTLSNYFDLLVSGNYMSAYYLWTEECRNRADKLRISYENIPLKIDCTSPIVRDLDRMKYYLEPAAKLQTKLNPGSYSKLEYKAVVEGVEVKHDYYMVNDNGFYWLTYPQDYYTLNWPSIESKYLKIIYHYNLESFLHKTALDEADRFIERLGDSLGIDDDGMALLEKEKITYFFCETDEKVQEITGHLVKGTFDMASNDIISAFFPHYHELTHLMINFKLRKLPLYSLPIMREGIAVMYGGRWGKTPAALLPMTLYLYREKFVTLDSILTIKDFEMNATSDMSYLLAGILNSYLVHKLGREEYQKLYLEFSGELSYLTSLSLTDIKKNILQVLGFEKWESFETDFNKYLGKLEKEYEYMAPGKIKDGKEVFTAEKYTILENEDWIAVVFNSPTSEPPKGNLLFGKEEELANSNSALLNEHYKGQKEFEGYRYGIRYDQNEIGLYDYATNYLVAKYIVGINPSDDYYASKENKVYIKIKKDLCASILDSDDFKLLNE